jgi:hypothetical protein
MQGETLRFIWKSHAIHMATALACVQLHPTRRLRHFKVVNSHGKMARVTGLEPATSGVTGRTETIEIKARSTFAGSKKANHFNGGKIKS